MAINEQPIRVLQINIGQVFGGVSSMLFNIYKKTDHEKIQFDFLAPRKSSFSLYRQEIEANGGKIIELNTSGFFIKRKIEFWKKLYRTIKKDDYKIIHCNSGSVFFNLQVAIIAKLNKCEKIIVHSHNAGNDKRIKILLGNLVKWLFPYSATHFLTCSEKAGYFMFPQKLMRSKKYRMINNGVDIEKFQFDLSNREKIRNEMKVTDQTVFLHVGRFTYQKNHKKLIQIFSECLKSDPDAVLLLAGEGELKEEIQSLVKRLGIAKQVRFLGLRKDISKLMSASDIFLLPSHYEGLPVVGIEAQANGLPCCFSNEITNEVNLIPEINRMISLDDPAKLWAETIQSLLLSQKEKNREQYAQIVKDAGFSLEQIAQELTELYRR